MRQVSDVNDVNDQLMGWVVLLIVLAGLMWSLGFSVSV